MRRRVLGEVPDLADGDQLGHAGRGRGEVAEQPAVPEQPGQRARPQLVAQPLVHGALGLHRHREQPGRQLDLLVAGLARAEQPGEPLLLGHLADHRAPPAPRADQAEGGGDGGLADPALAGHDDQAPVEQRGHRADASVAPRDRARNGDSRPTRRVAPPGGARAAARGQAPRCRGAALAGRHRDELARRRARRRDVRPRRDRRALRHLERVRAPVAAARRRRRDRPVAHGGDRLRQGRPPARARHRGDDGRADGARESAGPRRSRRAHASARRPTRAATARPLPCWR